MFAFQRTIVIQNSSLNLSSKSLEIVRYRKTFKAHWVYKFTMIHFFSLIWLLSTIFFSTSAFAESTLLLRTIGNLKWDLSSSARIDFESFLTSERKSLLRDIPGLQFPENFDSFKQGVVEYSLSTSPEYKNREVSCQFLARVAANIRERRDALAFERLTNNGKVCIPRDVPDAERSQWALSLAQFLWTRPWIPAGGTMLSLEQQIIKALRIKDYQRPEIRILTTVDFDGYGYNRSAIDQKTISANTKLSDAMKIAKDFTPNDPSSTGDLGPDLARLAQQRPASIGEYLIGSPTIYITNNWPPEALVELLAHEYGHVLHNGIKTIFSDHTDWIEINSDPVHNEGAAEAAAWQSLCGIYETFPEIKVFHILKLKLFSDFKRQDAHLVGAAAFASLFHSSCANTHVHFYDFLGARSLVTFLTSHGSDTLKVVGRDPDSDLILSWK